MTTILDSFIAEVDLLHRKMIRGEAMAAADASERAVLLLTQRLATLRDQDACDTLDNVSSVMALIQQIELCLLVNSSKEDQIKTREAALNYATDFVKPAETKPRTIYAHTEIYVRRLLIEYFASIKTSIDGYKRLRDRLLKQLGENEQALQQWIEESPSQAHHTLIAAQ